MKPQNSLKALNFVGAMAMTICLAPLTSNGDGTSHGNSTDRAVPYAGFKATQPLDNALVIPQIQRNFNRPEITSRSVDLPDLEKMKLYKVSPFTLFYEYTFPADRSALDRLYLVASQKKGDYSRLNSDENPFSSFQGNEYDTSPSPLAERLINEKNAIYPIEGIPQLADNLRQDFQITVNSQMTHSNCRNCSWSDYEPIPNGGITLEAYCKYDLNSLDSKGYFSSRVGTQEYYPTGARFHITSQSDQIALSVPLFPRAIANRLRLMSCDRPEILKYKLELYCEFRPVTDIDSKKLKKAFNLSVLSAVGRDIQLETFTANDALFSAGTDFIQKPLYIGPSKKWGESATLIGSYRDKTFYVQSEADLAEILRKSFVKAYELLKKAPIENNNRIY